MYSGGCETSGCRSALKSGAAASSGSGSGIKGAATLSGIEFERRNCGDSCDAARVFGMSARAEVKSEAVGFVRRPVDMEVWM